MTTEQDARNIYKILDKHGTQLSEIQGTLQKIAVQDEQIRAIRQDMKEYERKLEEVQGPNGCLSQITKFQASCPRSQVKWLWWVVIPISLTQAAIGLTLLGTL